MVVLSRTLGGGVLPGVGGGAAGVALSEAPAVVLGRGVDGVVVRRVLAPSETDVVSSMALKVVVMFQLETVVSESGKKIE